jgi:hypothetical protein
MVRISDISRALQRLAAGVRGDSHIDVIHKLVGVC